MSSLPRVHAVCACGIRRRKKLATVAPLRSSIARSLGIATISFSLSRTPSWASATLFSAAKALTTCAMPLFVPRVLEGPPQALAVDGDELAPAALAQGLHPAAQDPFQLQRVQPGEDAAEGVMRRDAVRQVLEHLEPFLPLLRVLGHVLPGVAAARVGDQGPSRSSGPRGASGCASGGSVTWPTRRRTGAAVEASMRQVLCQNGCFWTRGLATATRPTT